MGRSADDAWAALPLRARMPEYAALFATGLVATAAVGGLIGLLFNVPLATTMGYSFFGIGLICVLGGGAAGGDYKSLGLGQGAGRVKFVYDEDPHAIEDLRSARRPGRNPPAFWLIIAGFLYGAIGLLIANTA